jgi:hypothetical protein
MAREIILSFLKIYVNAFPSLKMAGNLAENFPKSAR